MCVRFLETASVSKLDLRRASEIVDWAATSLQGFGLGSSHRIIGNKVPANIEFRTRPGRSSTDKRLPVKFFPPEGSECLPPL